MTVLTKLFTAMKGAANEAGEAIVDHQALRILDQEMRDARKELAKAKEQLTKVMAEHAGVARDVQRLRGAIAEHEEYANKALDKGEAELAEDICARIAEFEEELRLQEQAESEYVTGVNRLKRQVKSTERNILSMSRQVGLIKATERIQKANAAAGSKFSGSQASMVSATASLERIKQRQQERTDRTNAAQELAAEGDGRSLDQRLRDAGILGRESSAGNVLERIRAKREKNL